MTKIYHIKGFFLFKNILRSALICVILSSLNFSAFAQCPPNIDFEYGDFTGWKLLKQDGFTGGTPNPAVPTLPADRPYRYDMYSTTPGNGTDLYGGFPKNCPNGSGHSIRIGVEDIGQHVDEVSYTFTIPVGQNTFSLLYNYAIVLNDGGGSHNSSNQPGFRIIATNVTDGSPLPCPFPPIIVGGTLPGFTQSGTSHGGPVWYKPWSAASINLDNLAGKTIQISFMAYGCGLNGGSHFGYAYIDVASQCGSSFVGAVFCPEDAFINVTAPYGYDTYTWYDSDPTVPTPPAPIGSGQTINFTPPPPAGTTIFVKMDPFAPYGCTNVQSAQLLDTLTIQSVAGADQLSCQNAPVQLGGPPKATYIYSWSPTVGLSNPNIANPIATPSVTTQYVVTTTSAGGGCKTTDTVLVKAAVLDTTVNITGPIVGCITPANPTVLTVPAADSIQWYRNTFAIPGATGTTYSAVQTGNYHVTVFSFQGCSLTSTDVSITANPTPVVGFKSNTQTQCFNGNQFVFTDTSSIAFGTMTYQWDMGDASTLIPTQHVPYSYARPGTYRVKQLVISDKGCVDSAFYTVTVFDSPVAAFDSDIKGTCFKNNQFVFTNSSTLAVGTIKYLWSFGDTNTDTAFNVTHSYLQPRTYTVRLTTTSDKGCPNDSAFDVTVHPDPRVDIKNPNPQQCFGNNLFIFPNNSDVLTGSLNYTWYYGDGTFDNSINGSHSYTVPGEYTVKMVALSDKGCTDSTTTSVKILKYALADFTVEPICTDMRLPLFNKTINTSPSSLTYYWDFDNGDISTVQSPVYSYTQPGTYNIQLSISNIQCPQTVSMKKQTVVVDAPAPALRYPDVEAVMNFPTQLRARQIANSVAWVPNLNLDFATAYMPKFKGLNSQLYYVQLKTRSGCLTVDTQLVQIKKKIDIYVPTSFTPNGDGINDYLYPTLMGYKQLNYFRVYDRWGKVLYQSKTERPGWNGRIDGNSQETKAVVWEVEAVDVDGVVHKSQGTTILIR